MKRTETRWSLRRLSRLFVGPLCLLFVIRMAGGDGASVPVFLSNDSSEPGKWRIYHTDPNHISNRLYRSLFLRVALDGREFGRDELDPLLWSTTKHLLSGSAHREALGCLDEFLETHAERLISDPMKRAVLQRDLWAIFDWLSQSDNNLTEIRELQSRLVKAIRRLALTAEQIHALPGTYEEAIAASTFATSGTPDATKADSLPQDLFKPDGSWVQLSIEGGPIAPAHVANFSGRSVFQVFVRLPGGRKATLAYLKRLSKFQNPWMRDRRSPGDILPNPRLPQFPPRTQLALVRRMVVIDSERNLTATGIVESVQVRIHRSIPVEIQKGFNSDRKGSDASLEVYQFKLSRAKLFARDSGGLRAVARDEKEFPLFQSHGIDLFDLEMTERESMERHLRPVLDSCSACHFRPGIHSVLSRVPDIVSLRVRNVRRDLMPTSDAADEVKITRAWKEGQASWRRLLEMWQSQ